MRTINNRIVIPEPKVETPPEYEKVPSYSRAYRKEFTARWTEVTNRLKSIKKD